MSCTFLRRVKQVILVTKKKPIVVLLDQEQIDWLESKIEEGYSKPGLIRYAVKRLMEEPPKAEVKTSEPDKNITKQIAKSNIEEPKKVDIDKVLDFAIKCCEEGKLDGSEFDAKYMIEISKDIKEKLKNIDHLPAPMAFTLGQFKGEMELKIAMWLQRDENK